jgi:hypothetical protein
MGAETRIVEQEEMAVARQWHGKHDSMAMNTGMQQQRNCWRMFSMQSMPRLYKESQLELSVS